MTPRERPMLSVVICVRNGADCLRAQLDALAAQEDSPSFELIVVDNGSSDDTVEVYESWRAGDIGAVSTTALVDASDQVGIARARNAGARHARTGVIAFCDADDVVAPGWVSAAHAAMAAGAQAVGGEIRTLQPGGRRDDTVLLGTLDGVSSREGGLTVFRGCNFAVTANAFRLAGGFDESLPPYGCDDVDICLRLHARGVPIDFSNQMIVYYAVTTGVLRRMRRAFRTGIAQACLWYRHPRVYGPIAGLAALAWRIPSEAVRASRLPGSAGTRVLAGLRRGAAAAGELYGVLAWVRGGRLAGPRYFREKEG